MLRTIFLAILILNISCITNSYAKWVKITETEDFQTQLYVDYDTLGTKNGKKYIWTLIDSKTPNDKGAFSRKAHMIFDCSVGQSKILSLYLYSGNMGLGKIITKHNNVKMEWRSVLPGSIQYKILDVIC
tara:strand:- start:196 stop:582 length:387 start_codon:yes stop_codon:yes gene_type:complete